MISIVFSVALFASISDAKWIASSEAIERSRYAFVIGNKPPFEKQYPRSLFEKRLHDEKEREAVLWRVYQIRITASDMEEEFSRIEKSTQAPDQWEAMKAAVHDDRHIIEEVICRPLLVDRALHAKFAFDQKIHARAHEQAREARAAWLAGREPAGAAAVTINRSGSSAESTADMLSRARQQSQSADPMNGRDTSAPVPIEAEAVAALEKQIHKPGDVSHILEYPDRFEVYRLIEATPEIWRADVVQFPKEAFDSWYERVRLAPHPK